MATINTAEIENFDNMTADEKVNALLGFEIPESVDLSGYVLKSVLDKKASEAASLSRQLKEKEDALKAQMSEADQRKLEEEEAKKAEENARKELEEKYKSLTREFTVMKRVKEFTSLEMDEKTAASAAAAFTDGDEEKFFPILRKFMDGWKDSLKKSVEAELMKNTPQPFGAIGASGAAEDRAIARAKEMAAARAGGSKSFNDSMAFFLKH